MGMAGAVLPEGTHRRVVAQALAAKTQNRLAARSLAYASGYYGARRQHLRRNFNERQRGIWLRLLAGVWG